MLIIGSIFLIIFLIVFIFIIKMMKENSQKVILAIYLIVVLSIILFLVEMLAIIKYIMVLLLFSRLRQELCVNGKAHSVDQVKTLILMYHVFL